MQELSMKGEMASESQRCFTIPDVWHGGYYELKIWLGTPSDPRITVALQSVWESSLLEGPYAHREREPAEQPVVSPVDDHLLGVAQIGGTRLPFGTYLVREEDELGSRVADFLGLYLPLGGLSTIYPVGSYPFGSIDAARIWRPDVDRWFLQLLRSLGRPFEFQLGVVGFEVELTAASAPGLRSDWEARGRAEGIIFPEENGLRWRPPITYES